MPKQVKASTERVKTGIPGLDKLIEGGFMKGSSILVTGSTGTGKTIFCCQFLWEGLQNGEKCMYITFEELPEEIKADASVFGWDLAKYEKSGKFIISSKDPFQTTDVTTRLKDEIMHENFSRVVVDSTSLLGLYFKNPHDVRRELYKLINALKESGATSLLTAEAPSEDGISRFGVEEYVVDGVVHLRRTTVASTTSRTMEVVKMRRTKMGGGSHSLEMTSKGITVKG